MRRGSWVSAGLWESLSPRSNHLRGYLSLVCRFALARNAAASEYRVQSGHPCAISDRAFVSPQAVVAEVGRITVMSLTEQLCLVPTDQGLLAV